MISYLPAALLGVVQGFTEFLPVSSTAHLLLVGRAIGFNDPASVFTETIQLGSILAIMWLYRVRLAGVLAGLFTDRGARRFVALLLVAFAPAVVAGLLFAPYVEAVLHQSPGVIAGAFILGGVVMLAVERGTPLATTKSLDDVGFGQAAVIGACQALALVPGVSRSGATIVGGLLAGLDRATAAEFSFFVAMPTLTAAFARSAWAVRGQLGAERAVEVGVGLAFAFVASAVVVRPFLGVVRRVGFGPFAWYRLVAGGVIFALAALGRF